MYSNIEDDFSSILLPTSSLGHTLRELRRSVLSIPNRLNSIQSDSEFVARVGDAYQLPLIANERCGSWYIPPERRRESVYFKSTDGHPGQWGFSLRRLNLQILNVIAEKGGCIVVDSTRRGKLMPDALSKTIPIWCAVLNGLLFPGSAECGRLYTPSRCVSGSEHHQIQALISGFVDRLSDMQLDLAKLKRKLSKPLRPLWITQYSSLPAVPPTFEDISPVILCNASRCVLEGDVAADGYVQGAGDDNEHWSQGLTADVFWNHNDELISASESDLPGIIELLMSAATAKAKCRPDQAARATGNENINVGMDTLLDSEVATVYDYIIHCSPIAHEESKQRLQARYLHLRCRSAKLGSRDLRSQLHRLSTVLESYQARRVLVCCPTGTDLAVGVTLYIGCALDARKAKEAICSSTNGQTHGAEMLDKEFIRKRLARMSAENPSFNPSRATLLAVNDALLSDRG